MTEETKPETPAAGEQQQQQGSLAIQKIYVKDLSFEAPGTPMVFTEEWKPTVDLHVGTEANPVEGDMHEIVLTVTVTLKFGEKTVYVAEVQQAGLFVIQGFPEQHRQAVLATVCPNILFPYAREAVSDVVNRGGFPQMLLAPVNFEHLYAQELQRRQAEQTGAASH